MNAHEIEREISRLENSEADYTTCQRLATLYVVLDHLNGKSPSEVNSRASMAGSEFLSVALSKEPTAVLTILDEHMECIKTLYPTEYRVLMKRITDI